MNTVEGQFSAKDLVWQASEQRTPEWFRARAGKLTASTAGYLYNQQFAELSEKVFGPPKDLSGIPAIKHGVDTEPHAKDALMAVYPEIKEHGILDCSFIQAPFHPKIGASPDILLVKDGLPYAGVEIKCPYKLENHARIIYNQRIPDMYYAQIQFTLWVTMLPYWYFASFCPSYEAPLIRLRIDRDDSYINRLRAQAEAFLRLAQPQDG